MANAQSKLNTFWNSFGWSAYDENTVPVNIWSTTSHHISYEAGQAYFDEPISLSASLWERSTSWAGVVEKSETIAEYIGRGGITLPTDDGYIWIKRGSPFAQRMSDENDSIRRIYLNIEVEFFTNK